HLDNPIIGAKELYRILKSDGIAIISMPNMASSFGMLQWVYRKSGFRSLLGKPPLDIFQIQHSRYWFGNIMRILRDAGFQIDYACSISHVPYLWRADDFLEKLTHTYSFCTLLDTSVSRLPPFKYLGFNFIVVASKRATHTIDR